MTGVFTSNLRPPLVHDGGPGGVSITGPQAIQYYVDLVDNPLFITRIQIYVVSRLYENGTVIPTGRRA